MGAAQDAVPPGEGAPAVVLLSGGLDSATVLAMVCEQGFVAHGLAFRYGQRHAHELEAAKDIAALQNATLQIVDIDLRAFGGSALTSDEPVPKDRDEKAMAATIPITYVPARNTIFLSFALAKAEVLNARDLFIGANAVDYSGYPDCRPAFISAFEALANVATSVVDKEDERFRVHAPLMNMGKAEIIATGHRLGVDYGRTWSCYDPERNKACGRCDSCKLRHRGFVDAGIDDPTPYAVGPPDAE